MLYGRDVTKIISQQKPELLSDSSRLLTLRLCRSFRAPTFCVETESGQRVRFFLKRNKTLCAPYRCRSNKVKRSKKDLFKLAA